VNECVRCCNGHRFCLLCLGEWAIRDRANVWAGYNVATMIRDAIAIFQEDFGYVMWGSFDFANEEFDAAVQEGRDVVLTVRFGNEDGPVAWTGNIAPPVNPELTIQARFRRAAALPNIRCEANGLLQYLPRDAMRKRGHCCRYVSVRSSVCLSVTFVYCIQMAKDAVKLFPRPDSPIILVS